MSDQRGDVQEKEVGGMSWFGSLLLVNELYGCDVGVCMTRTVGGLFGDFLIWQVVVIGRKPNLENL
jgi:hypothetical protein